MEPDFSGWATKAGLRCSDGRTILPDAFKHQDKMRVPLVWQHGHTSPTNVLGHAILEARPEGVYAYCYFNNSASAKDAKEAVIHKDINQMSIWANELVQKAKSVFHGVIREVSLVLSGANPGAVIENVSIRHSSDGDIYEEVLEDQVIIHTGLPLEHENLDGEDENKSDDDNSENDTSENSNKENDNHKNDEQTDGDDVADVKEKTIQEVYESMNDEQREVLHAMVGEALGSDEDVEHADTKEDPTVQEVYDSMSDIQKEVLHFMIGEALQSAGTGDSAAQSAINDDDNDGNTDDTKGDEVKNADDVVKHNVFENEEGDTKKKNGILSHDALNEIVAEASSKKRASLKEAFEDYALAHGIDDIELLFPDAVAIDSTPELNARRTEWVQKFLPATRKVPFSRIKSTQIDITFEEARAKGYVKGSLKKEEYVKASRRTTIPTTVYKKQALDRDDIVDITEFDVVAFLQAEMRLMLDEEIARAALLGDGRESDSEDKIDEACIRPIVSDDELYTTQVYVNIGDASSSAAEIVDAVIANRRYYKGTGQPNFYTTETVIAYFLQLKDGLNRRMYTDLNQVASELRVKEIIPVEVMESDPSILGVIVNPVDYTFGATKGGEVNMFDQFDIDYNKHKYLIETRCCGALTKMMSAIVLRGTAAGNVLVAATAPTFDPETGALTIVDTAHVVYKDADTDTVVNAAGSPYTVASGATKNIVATPASGYYFADSVHDDWSFTAN